jgi:hypothetical protein
MPSSNDPARRATQLSNLRNFPAAPEGNENAATHRGYASVSVERREEHVSVIYSALADIAPLREAGELPAADQALLMVAAETHARLQDVKVFLDEHGVTDSRKRMRPAVLVEQRLRRELVSYLVELGMSARSRAKMGVDVARMAATVDASTALSEPDPEIRAQLLRRLGLLDADGSVADGE